eukprot:UN00428
MEMQKSENLFFRNDKSKRSRVNLILDYLTFK